MHAIGDSPSTLHANVAGETLDVNSNVAALVALNAAGLPVRMVSTGPVGAASAGASAIPASPGECLSGTEQPATKTIKTSVRIRTSVRARRRPGRCLLRV